MSERSLIDYYQGREQKERSLAVAASSPAIAAIHTELAERYSYLASEATSEPQPEAASQARFS